MSPISALHGNLLGLSPAQKHRLERLYRRRVPARSILTHDLAREMAAITRELNRCVGLLVDRAGRIEKVSIGDSRRGEVPRQPSAPSGRMRFCTLRFLATRLDGGGQLGADDLAPLALHRLDALAVVDVEASGAPGPVRVAHLHNTHDGRRGNPLRAAWRAGMRWAIGRFATRIVGVSEGVLDSIVGPDWHDDLRCTAVYNGVDTTAYEAAAEREAVRQEDESWSEQGLRKLMSL